MNRPTNSISPTHSLQSNQEPLGLTATPTETQFALAAAALLHQGTLNLAPKISDRLFAARLQALRAQKSSSLLGWQRWFTPLAVSQSASYSNNKTRSQFSSNAEHGPWFNSFMWLIACVVVIFSLMAITDWQQESRLQDLAVLDAAILTDDVPPNAYTDSGFLAFLKASRDGGADVNADSLEPATAAKTPSPS